MIPGAIVWCTITATLNILGQNVKDYETAAKGIIRSQFGETLIVDFSEYASKQKYIGDYQAVQVSDYMCTKDE